MAMHGISLGELAEFADGKLAAKFDRLLSNAIADCSDRPAVKKSRKVTLVVEVTPQTDQEGDCYDVKAEVDCKASLPSYRSAPVVCQIRKQAKGKQGELFTAVYNDLSPDDPNQKTIE